MQADRDGKNDTLARFAGPGVYPVEYAHWLLNPARRLFFPPSRLARLLQLKPTDQVLEVGCGPGYFSPAVARAVPQGKLTLYDLQPGMLALAEARLRKRGCTNFESRTGSATSLPFEDRSFDVVFMVTVLGEVGDVDARARAVAEAARVLKTGGLFSATEMFGDPDYVRAAQLEDFAAAAGLVRERRYGPRFFYTLNFRKPR
ncbi:MAG TPA: class I SAM-dependent methyltransferase [Rhizomicrobium sp.]|nr:class I SAM-dependent methyltransferase [Rhizomicrobium sp.]